MGYHIEADDLIGAVKLDDIGADELLAGLTAWLERKEGQGYDVRMLRSHLLDFELGARDLRWVGSK